MERATRIGTDISGWVEVRELRGDVDHGWNGIVRIENVVERRYYIFALLFDVENTYWLASIAPHRGLPPDISGDVRVESKHDCVNPSWVTWEEIKHADWEQEIELGDYDDTEDEYVLERLPIKDAVNGGWEALFTIMEALATCFGDDNVQLVAWFDQ